MESTRCHRDVFKQQCPSAFSGMDPSRCLSDVMGARSARLRCVERSRLGMASDGWGHEPSAPLGKEKTGPNPTDRAKRGVKRSLLVEGHGIPIGLEVEGANRNDFKMLQATLRSIPIARPEPTEEQRQNLCLDKGYDYNEVRELGKVFGYTLHIRARKEEAQALKRQVGWKRKTLGGGAHTQLDEPLSRSVDSLGEKGRELSRPASSRLCLYYLPSCWPIGIGSKLYSSEK
jgi:Transposase DDE domain